MMYRKGRSYAASHSTDIGRTHSTLSSNRVTFLDAASHPVITTTIQSNGDGGTNGKQLEPTTPSTENRCHPKICSATTEIPETKEKPVCKKEEAKSSCENEVKALGEKSEHYDLSEPKLLTSLKIIESLHELGEKCAKSKISSHESAASKKATRKVNIPFEEKVYKDLITLEVRDEEFVQATHPPKAREILRPKDPEPILTDFYRPTFNKEGLVEGEVALLLPTSRHCASVALLKAVSSFSNPPLDLTARLHTPGTLQSGFKQF